MMNNRLLPLLPLVLAVSACAALQPNQRPSAASDLATEFAPAVSTSPLGTSGRSVAALDTTSAAEKAAALAAPAKGGEQVLGKAVVALGAPAAQGLWVQTSLVTEPRQGRVTAANGQSLAVELRPGSGAALMSLAAYQALGIPLTALPELTLLAG